MSAGECRGWNVCGPRLQVAVSVLGKSPLKECQMKKAGLIVSECLLQAVVRNEVGQVKCSPVMKALKHTKIRMPLKF